MVERAPDQSAWVFFDGDLIVLSGLALEDGCLGQVFETPTATTVAPPGGATVTKFAHADHVAVFDAAGFDDPLGWLFGFACSAVLAGEPGPEPLASGDGWVTFANGNLRLTARVTTSDGRSVHLNVVSAELGSFPDLINYGG